LIFASIMIIPLLYYLTMIIWMPRSALERFQFILGLSIFTVFGPLINICVTLYAVKNMDNFGWGKTRKVVAETGEAEEPDADEQRRRIEEALSNNEKVIGSQVPDEENQQTRVNTPYTAEPPKPRATYHSVGTSPIRRHERRRLTFCATSATSFPNLADYAGPNARQIGHDHRSDGAGSETRNLPVDYFHAYSCENREPIRGRPLSLRRTSRIHRE
jgi:hypothetical protein